MLTPIGPRSDSPVILKQVHFRQKATRKKTLTGYLARKKLRLSWMMNKVLDPYIDLIAKGIDPFPTEGEPLVNDDQAAAA